MIRYFLYLKGSFLISQIVLRDLNSYLVGIHFFFIKVYKTRLDSLRLAQTCIDLFKVAKTRLGFELKKYRVRKWNLHALQNCLMIINIISFIPFCSDLSHDH